MRVDWNPFNEKCRAVNTLIASLMTALAGTYHAIKFGKYGNRYLAEVQFRFNRRYDMRAMLGCLLRAPAATPRRSEWKSELPRLSANQDNLAVIRYSFGAISS